MSEGLIEQAIILVAVCSVYAGLPFYLAYYWDRKIAKREQEEKDLKENYIAS